MDQALLRQLALERIQDAQALLAAGRWSYAYYVAGYAVECGLKSCILARMIYTGGVFKDRKFAEWCWTHTFGKLIELAGLQPELNARLAANPIFVGHWGTALRWTETSRYETRTEIEARELVEAITQIPDGVLPWIQTYW